MIQVFNMAAVKTNPVTSFGAGKTILMTDFDGTYMPEKSSDVYKKSYKPDTSEKISHLKKYFGAFNDFYNIASDMFEDIITTGRKLTSFQRASGYYKNLGINIPNPSKLIEKGGSNIYRRVNAGYEMEQIKESTSLEKAFDIKNEIKLAKKNNDFVIAAGNENNDKELLNIFSYVDMPMYEQIPYKKEHIAPLLKEHPNVRRQIQELPLKIIFFSADNEHSRYNKSFYDEIHRIFPDKFDTVEHKKGKNIFLRTIKDSIKVYCSISSEFKKALLTNGAKEYINSLGMKKL